MTLFHARLDQRGVLAIGGPDRVAFLQGLVTNDITRAAPDRALYAALLTPQGRILHDFFVVAVGEALLLEAEAAGLDDLRTRLSRYRLRSKVTLEPRPDLAVGVVFGDGAGAACGLPDQAGAAAPAGDGAVFVDPRLAAAGARCLASAPPSPGTAATATDYDTHRLRLGLPDGAIDLEPERALPLEAGFEELGGVDYGKGCYMGQELTARMHYRGLVKKRLLPVRIESGAAPAPGTVLTAGGKEAAEMRSSRDGLGLALLRLEALAPELMLEAPDGARLRVTIPDWVRLPPPKEAA